MRLSLLLGEPLDKRSSLRRIGNGIKKGQAKVPGYHWKERRQHEGGQ
jgi:hypothetical protein